MKKVYISLMAVAIISVTAGLFLMFKNGQNSDGVITANPENSSTFSAMPKVQFIPTTSKNKFKTDISNAPKRSNQKPILLTI